jgi:hypothetical protein
MKNPFTPHLRARHNTTVPFALVLTVLLQVEQPAHIAQSVQSAVVGCVTDCNPAGVPAGALAAWTNQVALINFSRLDFIRLDDIREILIFKS